MTYAPRKPLLSDVVPIGFNKKLVMADQPLATGFQDPAAPGIRAGRRILSLRAMVLLLPFAATVALAWLSTGWFALDGQLTVAEGALIGVTGFAFYWVVLSVVTAVLGLFWRPRPLARPLRGLQVAVLLPMYGEDAAATIGNTVALLAGLSATPRHRFTLHILSDTRDLAAVAAEANVVQQLRARHPTLSMFYRRRAVNTDYKSGNIREWVRAEGHGFDAVLVLDADSIMSPAAVVHMSDTLAAEPALGLIQTIPRVLPGHTLWQGLQSFASEVYGTNLGKGFAMWTGPSGNFLGHNALIRTHAFATCAGLPHLAGHAPRGGVILSHDFVEAALLRRGGWGVRMLPEAAHSFEDTPENLIGYLRRDRRWCQGNMQHLRLLATPGLNLVSRFHLLQGAMAYLASVWWLVLLILWTLPGQGGAIPDLFTDNPFMPVWPSLPPVTQAAMAMTVGLMLLGPKFIGIVSHIRNRGLSLAKIPAFATSVLAEIGLSVLIAPTLMVHQVRAVLRTLMGFDAGWMPHVAGQASLKTLIRFHATETVLGLGLSALALTGQLTPWLMPVAVSLVLAVPLAWLVQRDISLPFTPGLTKGGL